MFNKYTLVAKGEKGRVLKRTFLENEFPQEVRKHLQRLDMNQIRELYLINPSFSGFITFISDGVMQPNLYTFMGQDPHYALDHVVPFYTSFLSFKKAINKQYQMLREYVMKGPVTAALFNTQTKEFISKDEIPVDVSLTESGALMLRAECDISNLTEAFDMIIYYCNNSFLALKEMSVQEKGMATKITVLYEFGLGLTE